MEEPGLDEDDAVPPTDLGEANSYLNDPAFEARDEEDAVDDFDDDGLSCEEANEYFINEGGEG